MTFSKPFAQTSLTSKSDGDLLRLYAKSGSESAFAELRRRYARLVYASCLRETDGDATLAEDAAQGVFLLLSQKSHALQGRRTLADWLYVAARLISRNLCRQERRRQKNLTLAMTEMTFSAADISAPDPLWEQVEPHLHDALNRLKTADREAVLLRFMQQQSLAEVGVSLGVSENAARMRVQRALEKLRTHLGRAGVAVPLVILGALLAERSAPAAPLAFQAALTAPLSSMQMEFIAKAVSQTALRLSLTAFAKPLLTLLILAGLGGACCHFQVGLTPQKLSVTEQRRQFQALDGIWQGSLEYADDRTGQHFTYPTTVTFHSSNGGDGLSFVAAYVGSPVIDRTTFTSGPSAGQFSVTNGGPQSSHALDGIGKLVKMRSGGFMFQGTSKRQETEVQIQFTKASKVLTIQEQYRRQNQRNYQFRNRFTLRKQAAK